jgi:hypothetical protein
MDVFSTELGIRLNFVKTSEFRGGGGLTPQTSFSFGTPLSTLHVDGMLFSIHAESGHILPLNF